MPLHLFALLRRRVVPALPRLLALLGRHLAPALAEFLAALRRHVLVLVERLAQPLPFLRWEVAQLFVALAHALALFGRHVAPLVHALARLRPLLGRHVVPAFRTAHHRLLAPGWQGIPAVTIWLEQLLLFRAELRPVDSRLRGERRGCRVRACGTDPGAKCRT